MFVEGIVSQLVQVYRHQAFFASSLHDTAADDGLKHFGEES
jgi:hypothetical protein